VETRKDLPRLLTLWQGR